MGESQSLSHQEHFIHANVIQEDKCILIINERRRAVATYFNSSAVAVIELIVYTTEVRQPLLVTGLVHWNGIGG